MNRKKIWLGVLSALAAVIIIGAFIFFASMQTILIVIATVVVIIVSAFATSFKIVPESYEYVIESFGEYSEILDAGPHLILPFGIQRIRAKVYLGQQMMKLYLDEQVPGSFGGGDVEFKDCSGVGVNAFLYFKIIDSYKATYGVSDLFEAVEEKADGVLRTNFMMYNLDEAMNLKGKFSMENIACYVNLVSGSAPANLHDDYLRSEFYTGLTEFGVEPKSFVVADFRLPQEIIDQRQKKLVAEKDKEVAQVEYDKSLIEKRTTVVRAEAKKDARTLEGDGEASYIERILKAANLQTGQSGAYLAEMAKWRAISDSQSGDKVILIEGNGEAGTGAKFGTGLSATKK